MKQAIFKIKENRALNDSIFEMTLEGDTSAFTRPGQFAEVAVPGYYLRRPISVCHYEKDSLTLIYKTVGEGTFCLSKMKAGETLDLLTGLGNGFDCAKSGNAPVLVGGGVGVPPLFGLCRELIAQGKDVTVVLGFGKKEEVFYENEFKNLGARVLVTTVDGLQGIKGFATKALEGLSYSYLYTCGPMAMMRSLNGVIETSGEFSLEERMGCGFGACMGCTIHTKNGSRRVCKDGPVFEREDIIW